MRRSYPLATSGCALRHRDIVEQRHYSSCILGEPSCKDTAWYGYFSFLIAILLVLIACSVVSGYREFNNRKLKSCLMRKMMEIREATSRTPDDPDKPIVHARCSAPYSYTACPSRRAGSPTLTAATLDTGHTSADTIMTTERKLVVSGLPLIGRARSRAGSVARKTGGRITYEDGLGHDKDEEYEYIYDDLRQPLVLRASAPTKQSTKVINDRFGICRGFDDDRACHHSYPEDRRRSLLKRTGAIIPSTGAAKAGSKVIPSLTVNSLVWPSVYLRATYLLSILWARPTTRSRRRSRRRRRNHT